MLTLRRGKRNRRDDPWIEGYEAREKFHARTCNPYRGPGDSRKLWDDGWMEAAEKAKRLATDTKSDSHR